jgi:hypothetical protein
MLLRRLPWVLALVGNHMLSGRCILLIIVAVHSNDANLAGSYLRGILWTDRHVQSPVFLSSTVLISLGVGAIFYTQVALEVIPNDGSRDRLRA